MKFPSRVFAVLMAPLLFGQTNPVFAADELVVYSARNEQLIRPLFDAYTKTHKVEIKFITDKAAPLLARLKAEGKRSPADLLITVDAGNLWKASQDDVLARVNSRVLKKNIPDNLRDPDFRWFGLSIRARTIVYSPKRVNTEELKSYEDLADNRWKDRLCLRTSKKVYNQSLVATMIAHHGEARTERIVKGWVRNLATDVFSNDTAVMKAIMAGQCDVGIVNTYYYGRLLRKQADLPLKLFWPNQSSTGVHINVSGAGVTRYSKNKRAAIQFLEWLSQSEAQKILADGNLEYPVNKSVKANKLVRSWGRFKQDTINLTKAGALQARAVKLMDRAGYK